MEKIKILVEDYEDSESPVIFSESIILLSLSTEQIAERSEKSKSSKTTTETETKSLPDQDIHKSLKELEKEARGLYGLIKERGRSLNDVEEAVDTAGGALHELMNIIAQMEYELNVSTDKLLEMETKQEDLLAERDLLTQKLQERNNVQLDTSAIPDVTINIENIDAMRKMRDEARTELSIKTDDLELATDRRKQIEIQIQKETSSVYQKLNCMNKEKTEIIEKLNMYDNLRIYRLQEELKVLPESADRDRVTTAMEWLTLCQEERNLQNEIDDLEVESHNQCTQTTFALAVKKREMDRLDEISREYHEMMVRDGEDTGYYVREIRSASNLPLSVESMLESESVSEPGTDEAVDDANRLHHCSRRTDLAQNVDDDEYLRIQSTVLERNMEEYMQTLNLDSTEEENDVDSTMYSDTEDNIQDAVLEFSETKNIEQLNETPKEEKKDKNVIKYQDTSPSRKLPSNMESSDMNREEITAKIRGRMGLHFERTRGGSHTEIAKGTSVRATGSGTFSKPKKK